TRPSTIDRSLLSRQGAAPTELYTLSLHDALPIYWNHGLDSRAVEWVENRHWVFSTSLPRAWLEAGPRRVLHCAGLDAAGWVCCRSEEHTSELQSRENLVCRLLLEKKNTRPAARQA